MARTQESEREAPPSDWVEDGALLRWRGDAEARFTKCCRARLVEWPVMILYPDRPHQKKGERGFNCAEEIIGYLHQCRECHKVVPFNPNGYRLKVKHEWRRYFSDALIDEMAESKLTYQPEAGPGMAYWLRIVGKELVPIKFVSEPEPVAIVENERAKDGYQPGEDWDALF